jgi:hypothetical protein
MLRLCLASKSSMRPLIEWASLPSPGSKALWLIARGSRHPRRNELRTSTKEQDLARKSLSLNSHTLIRSKRCTECSQAGKRKRTLSIHKRFLSSTTRSREWFHSRSMSLKKRKKRVGRSRIGHLWLRGRRGEKLLIMDIALDPRRLIWVLLF